MQPVYVDILSGYDPNREHLGADQMPPLTPEEVAAQLDRLQPRAFDRYILPPFVAWYAWRSRQMPRMARRLLFAAGLWMGLRNWRDYQQLARQIASLTKQEADKVA